MATGKFVSYLRVSTDKQGRSGLGLEAQREGVARYLNGGRWQLVAEYVEVESGKRNDRLPELGRAVAACKKQKSKTRHCQTRSAIPQPGIYRDADGLRRGVHRSGQSTRQ